MSKIYEALRQAELDRANNSTKQSEPSSRGSSTAQAVLDSPQVRVTIADAMDRESALLPPADNEVAENVFDVPLASPANSREFTWSPSLSQLPALEERGAAVEQFRSLRSRMHEFRDLNKLKSILISSGLPQEGKSFIAANLAISFTRHKAARVLLIDGDMRRASLHKMLGTNIGPGLTEYLAGQATLDEIMQRPKPGEQGHPVPNGLLSLTFIAGGNEHEKAADLSGNHRFDRLIADASPHFDWIVVDSSPVNLVSDGVNLARACDGVLMVAREGITRYEAAQRALAELKAAKILGFVLNAVHNPKVAGGYYGYDGYDKVTP